MVCTKDQKQCYIFLHGSCARSHYSTKTENCMEYDELVLLLQEMQVCKELARSCFFYESTMSKELISCVQMCKGYKENSFVVQIICAMRQKKSLLLM